MASKKKATKRVGAERAVDYFERTHGPMTLGRALRAIRLGEEETLQVFAKRLGISQAHLSDVEHGRRVVSAERAAAWAKLLGYHAGQFVELALQAELDAAGLKLRVSVAAA
jgi:transcriptional regulator with XRE-family HTH domain